MSHFPNTCGGHFLIGHVPFHVNSVRKADQLYNDGGFGVREKTKQIFGSLPEFNSMLIGGLTPLYGTTYRRSWRCSVRGLSL